MGQKLYKMKLKYILPAGILLFFAACPVANLVNAQEKKKASSQELHTKLAIKDSLLFNAVFNTCSNREIENILANGFVFYQDKGYSAPPTKQARKEFIEKIKEFCAKKDNGKGIRMRREIVKNSLQVDALNQNEALQTGTQYFYIVPADGEEKLVEKSKFSRTWQQVGGDWKLVRELDYMVNTQTADNTSSAQTTTRYQPDPYTPVSEELYNTIAGLDSLYFDTYNTCDLNKMRSLMADSIEFYHDKGGLTTSLNDFMESIKNNICGKVTRQPVAGSIEVYPIHNYGAVETGYHRFFNKREPENGYSKPDKYIIIWQKKVEGWKIARVVSLH
ncbi:MAG: hypothetical protein JWM28_1065 [Chitinophagaceae bacterium]|nr:hypothetical protein [Chitinophagaceae bacterium]